MPHSSRSSPDSQLPSGGVELREDLPLKARSGGVGGGAGARCCGGGPRLIPAAFAALTAAITLALLTQIYYGDFELVPHGSVSSSAAACSRAGTDALKAGGRALDAAVAAALCLAVLAPHRTSLDASGALLYWEYRNARTQPPALYEWGGAGDAWGAGLVERPPRLVAAFAALHAQLGTLPWQQLITPAIQLAKDGYLVSDGLSAAAGTAGESAYSAGSLAAAPALADYLASLLNNTSAELSASWKSAELVHRSDARAHGAGVWRLLTAGAGAPAARALAAALSPPPDSPNDAQRRVLDALQGEARAGALGAGGVATGLAAVDRYDTYVALVTGMSAPFGSGPATAAGWARDEPAAPLDLVPAILLDDTVCGTRYVLGAESTSALAQAAAALVTDGAPGAVERARVAVRRAGRLALEAARAPPEPAALPAPPARPSAPASPLNASLPYAAVNLVQQRADALASHADSRGGGLASRF